MPGARNTETTQMQEPGGGALLEKFMDAGRGAAAGWMYNFAEIERMGRNKRESHAANGTDGNANM
jgi:hypothetical protein